MTDKIAEQPESDIEKAIRASGMDIEVYNRQHEQSIERLRRELPHLSSDKIREAYDTIRKNQEKDARLFALLPQIVYRQAKIYLEKPPHN